MTGMRTRQHCRAPGRGCAGRLRDCACLKGAILGLCARASPPPTTGQIVRELALGPIDIYAVLFAMEFEGLIDCRRTTPWTWALTARAAGYLRRLTAVAAWPDDRATGTAGR